MKSNEQIKNDKLISDLHDNYNIELDKLDSINEHLSGSKDSLISSLLNSSSLPLETIKKVTKEMYGLDIITFDDIEQSTIPYDLTNDKLLSKYNAAPFKKDGNTLYIAVNDPNDFTSLSTYQFNTGINTQSVLMSEKDIKKLKTLIKEKLNNVDLNTTNFDGTLDLSHIEANINDTSKNPVIEYVDKIIHEAISRNASDIHFEPYKTEYRIRCRQDGMLESIATLPIENTNLLNSRLKVLANLDISERRMPQDGRFNMNLESGSYDFRISTCPTLFGEKIVIRILDPLKTKLGIAELGYEEDQQELFLKALHRLSGIILVTGPTGSGKTLSLYTALSILNTPERNISTAEDPIEIYLPGINQVQVSNKTGLTFASTLRCFLRQDPDIMMVGEIRDIETAEIAIKAAQTGHLVLSTLHTNSAVETLNRLSNMGIPSYNLATSVTMIIAQRLIRKLCPHCKVVEKIPMEILIHENFPESLLNETTEIYTHNPDGCDNCTHGYSGRIGVYETLPISQNMQEVILDKGSVVNIRNQAIKEHVLSLRQAGIRKVLKGITSLTEVNRVTKNA